MKGGRSRTDADYGQGRASIAADDDVFLDEQALTKHLLDTMRSPSYRPPALPKVAVELMALAQQPDVTFDDVAGLLEQDALLTGQVMKLMRSPLYLSAQKVNSIKDALVRLGLKTLRDVVLEASLNVRVFRAKSYEKTMERLRRHNTMTAHLCRSISKYTAIDAEYSFMCGLLHDVGIAGALITLSARPGGRPPPDLVVVWPAVDRVHAEAASRMAELWGLSEEVQTALGAHHQVLLKGHPHPLAATVCLADELAHQRGFGLLPAGNADQLSAAEACEVSHHEVDRSRPRTLEQAREALGITPEMQQLIDRDADQVAGSLA